MFARIIFCMLIYYSLAAPLYNSFRRRCISNATRNEEQLMFARNEEQLMFARNEEQLMFARNEEQLMLIDNTLENVLYSINESSLKLF